jgi:hypothetical protein
MSVNLLNALSKSRAYDDLESPVAYFRTKLPWIGPDAYLHIIYKPASQAAIRDNFHLKIPWPLAEFLQDYNGARLFSGAINIYGVHRRGQLLNRTDFRMMLPYNLELENRNAPAPDPQQFLVIGGYFDSSRVCISRKDHRIVVFRESENAAYCCWENLGEWITTEIERLSILFTPDGKLLTDRATTLPSDPGRLA